jgi:hypothetical protein
MMPAQRGLRWWFVVPVCVVLGVLFIAEAVTFDRPPPDPLPLNPAWYTVETARGKDLQDKTIVGNCFICHAFWVPIPTSIETSNPRFAHANIVLNHGSNDRCYNCHQITDRNMYIANNSSSIMSQTPEQLCSRCHGLIYNDWTMGTHGKWTGKFQPDKLYDRKTYTCTECHDPHNPLFRYNVIAPPPTWPDKFIRSTSHGLSEDAKSGFLIDEKPKEIF